ncbi:MAG: hypothetical protein KF770_08160 [Anaerolineae bacterium]|nr:hypothetical protein [Anaerolineae bacterium]
MLESTLLETIQTLQHQAERLEREATALRQALADVAEVLVSPASVVARYEIEGQTYEITQAEVDAVKAQVAKSWSDSALYELAVVKKMSRVLRERPNSEQDVYFFKTVEAIQAISVADGTAVEDTTELQNNAR